MARPRLDDLPGFRRRFRVTHGPGWTHSEVEDDYHHMRVLLRHEGGVVTGVEPEMVRAPWTTCPEAIAQLPRTFVGAPLADFLAHGDGPSNCTHLHDLALLAAGHAADPEPLQYDILISDPIDGERRAELRRNGETVMSWVLVDGRFVEPAELAGLGLDKLRPWIASLAPAEQEAARILRWASMMANGRQIPWAEQREFPWDERSQRTPPRCYTFQPQNAVRARRIGEIRDFSTSGQEPLGKRQA